MEFILNKKHLIITLIIWIISQFFAYYLLNWLFSIFFFIGLFIAIIIFIIVQVIRIIAIKNNRKIMVIKTICLIILFNPFSYLFMNSVMEKTDWVIHYPFRVKAVELAKENKLKLKEGWNYTRYELPYKFPFVSYNENDIHVYRACCKTPQQRKHWRYLTAARQTTADIRTHDTLV